MRKQSNLDLIIPLKMILGAVYTKLKVALDYTCRKKISPYIEIKSICSKYCRHYHCSLALLCLTQNFISCFNLIKVTLFFFLDWLKSSRIHTLNYMLSLCNLLYLFSTHSTHFFKQQSHLFMCFTSLNIIYTSHFFLNLCHRSNSRLQ